MPGVKILVEFYVQSGKETGVIFFVFCLVTDLMSPSGLFDNPLLCFHDHYFIFPL